MEQELNFFEKTQEHYKKDFQLWSKKDITNIAKIPTDHESIAAKYLIANRKLETRSFFIKGNFFCYRKDNGKRKIKAYLDLDWAKIEFNELKEPKNPIFEEYDFEIKILKQGKFSMIYVKDKEELKKWRNAFAKVNVILTDFHDEYKALKTIGRGGFSKVKISVFFFFMIEIFFIFLKKKKRKYFSS